MSDNDSLLERLSEPFPPQVIGTLNKGGVKLDFLPIAEAIHRLNLVLGVGNWSWETRECRRDPIDPTWIIAHVRLTIKNEDGTYTSFDGHGGQKIKMTKAGEPVDLGDEYKGAESDAFKKACSRIEVGLYLSRKPEALRYEREQAEAENVPEPVDAQTSQGFIDDIARLEDKFKDALRTWWKKEGLPAPADVPAEVAERVRQAIDHYLSLQDEELGDPGDTTLPVIEVSGEEDPGRPFD